jgi:hypothetical protein
MLQTWLRTVLARRPLRHRTQRLKRRFQFFARLMVEPLEGRVLPAPIQWINAAGGDWDTPGNWSSGTVPGSADDVTINLSGITITHNQGVTDTINSLTSSNPISLSAGTLSMVADSTVGDLSLAGGTLVAAGNLGVTGSLNWTSGTLGSGTFNIAQGAVVTISGGGGKGLNGCTLNNSGTITDTYTNSLSAGNGAILNNLAGGLFDIQDDGYLPYGNLGGTALVINNAGTFQKSAGNQSTNIQVAFNNTGTLAAQSGTLNVAGGGSSSGTFTTLTAATLQVTNTYSFTSGSQFTGSGADRLTNGTIAINASIAPPNPDYSAC